MSERRLEEFPFPLDDGVIAYLRLPHNGLTDNEYRRLQEFLWSLVLDPPEDTP